VSKRRHGNQIYRARGDQPVTTHRRRQQPNQRGENRTVSPIQARLPGGSTQHGGLVAQHEQLDVLGCRRTSEQQQPAAQPAEHQVEHPQRHGTRSFLTARSPGSPQVMPLRPSFGTNLFRCREEIGVCSHDLLGADRGRSFWNCCLEADLCGACVLVGAAGGSGSREVCTAPSWSALLAEQTQEFGSDGGGSSSAE
jgi:hypothetical protein